MNELVAALHTLEVPIWVPQIAEQPTVDAQPPVGLTCAVHYQGDNPLVLLWVDQWHVMAKKLVANVLHFLGVPLKQCMILGVGDEPFELAEMLSNTLKFCVGFGGVPRSLQAIVEPISVVNTLTLQQLIAEPQSKQQLMQDVWEHQLI